MNLEQGCGRREARVKKRFGKKFLVCRGTGYNRQSSKSFTERIRGEVFEHVVFLILESLGSLELVFILVMALVFFGPRKLPQLSRTLGKNLASFRKASEDFKRTWEKEVNVEEMNLTRLELEPRLPTAENSILANGEGYQEGSELPPATTPTIEAVEPDRVVPRQALESNDTVVSSEPAEAAPVETLPKREWL